MPPLTRQEDVGDALEPKTSGSKSVFHRRIDEIRAALAAEVQRRADLDAVHGDRVALARREAAREWLAKENIVDLLAESRHLRVFTWPCADMRLHEMMSEEMIGIEVPTHLDMEIAQLYNETQDECAALLVSRPRQVGAFLGGGSLCTTILWLGVRGNRARCGAVIEEPP